MKDCKLQRGTFFRHPPGTSDEHMSMVKLLKNAKPDGAVLVITQQEVAMETMRKELNFCKKMDVMVLVKNMSGLVCPCCKVSHLCAGQLYSYSTFNSKYGTIKQFPAQRS